MLFNVQVLYRGGSLYGELEWSFTPQSYVKVVTSCMMVKTAVSGENHLPQACLLTSFPTLRFVRVGLEPYDAVGAAVVRKFALQEIVREWLEASRCCMKCTYIIDV